MFLPEIMLWLTRGGWLMLLHLSAGESFPKPLAPQEEQALVARMLDGDREANDRAYASGDDSILASYHGADGVRLWIMTEWDRSATTVLFPEEY